MARPPIVQSEEYIADKINKSSVDPSRLKSLQGAFNKILRSVTGYPWYVRNAQIRRETKVLTLAESVVSHAKNLRASVLSHPNPTISTLPNYAPKTFDRVKRPCCLLVPDA
ncbi:hypothetical protein QAD02_009002 [Eretmocerus hayati]|uniref:Uncharacterized protein n=1 Tax=Eretmocerus hayati TaxID=131215 RepID=A0ACC2N816_9HYME|nr:hypothetical protein QAD02_009002 [Eretmocerus hayati]